jgi:hypothetical protein
MTAARAILIGAALAAFVYWGATGTDARVGVLSDLIQAGLTSPAQSEWDDIFYPTRTGMFDVVIMLVWLGLLFGGLPLAVFALAGHREWRRLTSERVLFVRVRYAVLTFQIVSVLLSSLWLVLLMPRVLWEVRHGSIVDGHGPFIPAYLVLQILAGIAAIPVWRRHMRTETPWTFMKPEAHL